MTALLGALLLTAGAAAQTRDDLEVGHWVEVRGEVVGDEVFGATSVEIREPDDDEVLIGVPRLVDLERRHFVLMGQRVVVSARTDWEGITLEELALPEPAQIKVEGHFRTPGRFDAREVSPRRSPGRSRITGRVDTLGRRAGGVVTLGIMRWTVPVGPEAMISVEDDRSLASVPLAPGRPTAQLDQRADDADDIRRNFLLTDKLSFGGQFELSAKREENFDLDDDVGAERSDIQLKLTTELVWEPDETFFALMRLRQQTRWRHEQDAPDDRDSDGELNELYGYWLDAFGAGVDLQVGRQDFDDLREWIYDENLDAIRAIARRPGVQLELSASTVFSEGSKRNRDFDNAIAYLSNGDEQQHLAAWLMQRKRTHGEGGEEPLWFGLRALGEWLPDQEIWADTAIRRGQDDETDYRGFAFDVGTTWTPPTLDEWYFTVGFAQASGDDDPDDGTDHAFRQTGLQDNNGRFGGVTSFRYYGEVMDPELSNLQVLTAGVGKRFGSRSSLDLVYHRYRQAEAFDRQVNTNLDMRPNGKDRDLGWGLDMIWGSRAWDPWSVEVTGGYFAPGDAYDDSDPAWSTKLQVRYKF